MSSLLVEAFDPPNPPPPAESAVQGSGVPGVDINEWSEKFNGDEIVLFQLIVVGTSTHVWIGTPDASYGNLALSMPATREGSMPTGTTLIGSHADPGAQRMAQRLTKRVGKPIFLSLNVRDEPELRQLVEASVLKRLADGAPQAEPPLQAALPKEAPVAPHAAAAEASGGGVAGSGGSEPGSCARVVEVFETEKLLQERAAALLLAAASTAIAQRGHFSIALSGGSIPKILSPPLLAAAKVAQFAHWHVLMADERFCPESDPDSSMGVWRGALLTAAGVPPDQIYAVDVAATPTVAAAAEAYERRLLQLLAPAAAADGAPAPGAPPTLDCVVLGMGPDGHTASLFPGHALLGESRRAVTFIKDSPKPPLERITMTLPVLNAARLAVFIATGASKAPMLKQAFEPDTELPAGLVLAQRTHWLVDQPAAAGMAEQAAAADHLYG
jgi:6-phosphogluconolactonase